MRRCPALRNALLMLLCLAGCWYSPTQELGGPAGIVWDELDQLESADGLMPVSIALEKDDLSGAIDHVNSDFFSKAVSQFEKSSLPDELSDHASDHAQLVKLLKSLQEAAKTSNEDDFQKKWNEIGKMLKQLRDQS